MKTLTSKTLALIVLMASATLALADPSGRVGRIAYAQGDVIFRNSVDDDATAAQVNWPVTSQNLIETRRNARAEIRIGSAAVRIDGDSELEVTQLDDDHVNLHLVYGSAYVRIRNPELAKDFALSTPQGRVTVSGLARFRIDTDRAPDSSVLSVLDGTARLATDESTFAVRAGKRATVANGDIRMTTLRPNDMQEDFDAWTSARDQRDDQSQSVRYVSAETTGYEELDNNGNWQTTGEYGAIWTPRVVPSGWAPYSVGRWTWVEPWGWTWIDSAPWGYAPFHYGRWVWFRQRWCWAPGAIVARPVWAPAMVGWVGGANWNVSFSAGAAPAVGWFPLAPREVFIPSYRVSPNYVRQVNITHVTNITNVTVVNGFAHVPAHERYQNREVHNAISVMPQNQFNSHRTVVVAPSPERGNPRRHFESAPVSAVVPAEIGHPNGFDRRREGNRNEPPRASPAPGQQNRFEQNNSQQTVSPTVRQPAPAAENPGFNRRRDDPAERRGNPPAAQQNVQPNPNPELNRGRERFEERRNAPVTENPEFKRGREPFVEKRVAPTIAAPSTPTTTINPEPIRRQREFHERREAAPVVTPAASVLQVREPQRVAPTPNPAQDAERERARREHEAQKQANEQARAQREQQRVQQPAPAPVKQAAPRESHEGQAERVRPNEKVPAEVRREEHPAASKEGNEGGRRHERKESGEGR